MVFYHAGQVCVSVQRVFVHESIVDEVANKLADYASKLVVGDQLDPKLKLDHLLTIMKQIELKNGLMKLFTKGGKILVGGKKNFW